MELAVFPGIDGNPSIDRYARELAANVPGDVNASLVTGTKSPGIRGVVYDRYVGYFRIARQTSADCNLIVSESYAFLLLALRPEHTVVVCHDVHPLIYRGWSGTYRFRYKLNLRLLPRAKAIVTVSEHTKKDLLKYCPFIPAEKVFTVHNGLETKWQRVQDPTPLEDVRRRYGLGEKKIVLHVGNDNWYKNFSSLIRAFADLNDRSLMLVKVGGCGPESKDLINKLRIADRFVPIHAADDELLTCLYSLAEMLVFPSVHEGFGWPPLEAMACGCPVITTRKASLPEVCADACLYVEPCDVEGITGAIRDLLAQPDTRADLASRGLLQARNFDWRQTAQTILRLIQ